MHTHIQAPECLSEQVHTYPAEICTRTLLRMCICMPPTPMCTDTDAQVLGHLSVFRDPGAEGLAEPGGGGAVWLSLAALSPGTFPPACCGLSQEAALIVISYLVSICFPSPRRLQQPELPKGMSCVPSCT